MVTIYDMMTHRSRCPICRESLGKPEYLRGVSKGPRLECHSPARQSLHRRYHTVAQALHYPLAKRGAIGRCQGNHHLMFSTHQIIAIGPAGSSQAHLWAKLELQLGARVSQNVRERAEKEAARIIARQEKARAKVALASVTSLARAFAEIADTARAVLKAERLWSKNEQAREAATWRRFKNAPTFAEAFTPTGRVKAGWVLLHGSPCYLPAAFAALAESRGVEPKEIEHAA